MSQRTSTLGSSRWRIAPSTATTESIPHTSPGSSGDPWSSSRGSTGIVCGTWTVRALADVDWIISGTFSLTPSSVVSRGLARFSRSRSILRSISGHDALSTVRTCVMLSQPGFDTIGMEPMTAGQVSDLTSNESFIHADGTVGLSGYFVQVFVCDGLLRQSGNGIGRGRTRGVGLILLHELRCRQHRRAACWQD
jgi:hypothetical protein